MRYWNNGIMGLVKKSNWKKYSNIPAFQHSRNFYTYHLGITNLKGHNIQCIIKNMVLFILFFLSSLISFSQETDFNQKIDADYNNIKLENVLEDLTSKTGLKFSYSPKKIDINQTINLQVSDITLSDLLVEIFDQSKIQYEIVGEYMVLKNSRKKPKEEEQPEIKHITISGYITDANNKETMIGATIYDPESKIGTMTNNYGFYSLTLPVGEFVLEASFLGYSVARRSFSTSKNITWDIDLEHAISTVEEVLITSIDKEQEIFKKLSSQTNIKAFEVKKQSAVLGETDVLKVLNNLPGISFHNDGSSYFYVRGGQRDQNLIILDEATIYNPSHLFGLFTPIIPDAIKHTEIYKADFPVQYGGRLSSVIDIRTRDGNMEKFSGSASVGLVTNRFSLEGPFKKNSSSYFVSYRRSHFGFLLKKISPAIQDFYFKDFTAKFNIKLGKKDRLFVTLYSGKDIFLNKPNKIKNGIEWGRNSFTLRWNHITGDKIFINTTFYTSKFDYFLYTDYDKNSNWNSHISSVNLKSEYTYYFNPDHKIKFGFNLGGYFFNPGNYSVVDTLPRFSVSTVNSGEVILYAGNEHNLTKRLRLNYGLRVSNWSDYGEATVNLYNRNYERIGTTEYKKGVKFYSKNLLEPRLSVSIKTGNLSSLKASYNRTVQHINLINNSIGPFNTMEVWLPTGPNIKPQKADIYNLGFIKTWINNNIDFNTDIFYKKTYNQVGYTYHADMLLNPLLDGQLRQGNGTAYGFEIFAKKTLGKISGHIGYAYTRSFLKITGLNLNRRFPSHQDKPVDFNILFNYQVKPRTLINMNLIYASGMRITTPTGFYTYRGDQVPYYSKQNNSKLPDYKRIDIGVTFNLNRFKKNYEHSLNISFYNFFGYQNPAFLYFNKIKTDNEFMVPSNKLSEKDLVTTYRFIYSVVPSITYNISF